MLVLPTLPVMPTTVGGQAGASPAGQRHQRVAGVGDLDRGDPSSAGIERRAAGQVGGRPGGDGVGDEVVPVAVGDDRHEQLARAQRPGVEGGPVDLDVRPDETAPRSPRPRRMPGTSRPRTVPSWPVTAGRTHLVVLFGGQSAEHDVSCVTATHVLRAIDTAKYRVTPIGISTDGEWALAEGAREALAAGTGGAARQARPARAGGLGDGRARRRGARRGRAHRRPAPAARSARRGRHGAGHARAGRRRLRRLRRARVGAGDGQGDGQAGARRQRHRPGPLPRLRRPSSARRACRRSSPTSSACRASSSRRTWGRRSASPRRTRSRSSATGSTTP